ncbi:hypothetical protein FEM48_Zijuj02G0028200 [Ziziphus jujuba var. spinosa]|uniref:Uncharacterized protein n=1 Tax=Ziziphus jujuba var. spinosa TaxID=714518 RepID=A0A978VT65_ZIZJJ|nr:hypothetical protein FEM48_Zijuj02G0028200 [Ziziphus jujuba var. spinosa]
MGDVSHLISATVSGVTSGFRFPGQRNSDIQALVENLWLIPYRMIKLTLESCLLRQYEDNGKDFMLDSGRMLKIFPDRCRGYSTRGSSQDIYSAFAAYDACSHLITNFGTTCVCRIPRHLREGEIVECVHIVAVRAVQVGIDC